jgi:hypothetical protein
MNVHRARDILELPEEYTEADVKKMYRTLAMKYHPDKGGDQTKFSELKEAYDLLSKGNDSELDTLFSSLFKNFTSFQFVPKRTMKRETFIKLTPREYFEGCLKKVTVKDPCDCQKRTCKRCVGCGYSANKQTFDVCQTCMGDGFIQKCDMCENGLQTILVNISIVPSIKTFEVFHELVGTIQLSIDKPYFFNKSKMYCTFDISLKESLTGFCKIFKDPFGESHTVTVKGIVKTNDGYAIHGKCSLVLVFNVIYPTKLSPEVIAQLRSIDF